jgi:DNA (cytosine-5)-methyltransferase 1
VRALDLFAGTGWGVACQRLGIEEFGVEIMPEAQATRAAAGMRTVYSDVWQGLDDPALVPAYDLLIASPPCQTFSIAGRGSGRRALDDVLRIVGAIRDGARRGAAFDPGYLREYARTLGDERTALVLTPLLYALRDRPTFVALEQVPTVLPVWQAIAEVLEDAGYSVDVGVLSAEQYGVPQTRKRAILVARRDGDVAMLPAPTHSRYYSRRPSKLDAGVLPWVSMAEALGWDPERAARTVTTKPRTVKRAELYGTRPDRPATAPAFTIVGHDGHPRGGFEWTDSDGATSRLTIEEAAVLQSYPRPALASFSEFRRPAPTIAGDPRIAPRGCKHVAPGCCSTNPAGEQRGRQFPSGSLTLTAAEAATLQTFPDEPAPFAFAGTKSKQFLQIGNAVPPLLAEAILRTFLP